MDSQKFFTKFINRDLLMVLCENNHLVFTVKQYEVVLRDQPANNDQHEDEKVVRLKEIDESHVRENKARIELKNVTSFTLEYNQIRQNHTWLFKNCHDIFQMLRDDQSPQIEKFQELVKVTFKYNIKVGVIRPMYFQVELKQIQEEEKNQIQNCGAEQVQRNTIKNEEPKEDKLLKQKQSYVMVDESEQDFDRIKQIKNEIGGLNRKISGLANVVRQTKINFRNRLNEVIHKTEQKFNVFDKRLTSHLNICHMNKQTHHSSRIAIEKTIKLIRQEYIFSQNFMNSNIKLKSEKSIMCNSKDNSLKISMIQPSLMIDKNYKQAYYYKISLKVVKIGAYIGVGIRDNQLAKKISYKQYRQNPVLDESLYILDFNGDLWSHYQINGVPENPSNAFVFEPNEIIQMKFIPDISKITFKLRSNQKRISMKVNPQLKFNFSFCVYLQGQGDEVQIVENIESTLHPTKKEKESYPAQTKIEAKHQKMKIQ